jgi:hypothetical protein
VEFTDVSLFLPNAASQPFPLHILKNGHPIWRIPYLWDDNIYALTPPHTFNNLNFMKFFYDGILRMPGAKIFNFHPIHVALNMRSMTQYEALKQFCPIQRATPKDVTRFSNDDDGTRTYLDGLLRTVNPSNIATVAAVCAEAKKQRRYSQP